MADLPNRFFNVAPQGSCSVSVNLVVMPRLVGISSESTSIPNNSRSNKAETPLNPRKPICLPEAFAAWRAFLVRRGGFSSRKDAETQRNCDRLGLTSGDLAGFASLRA
jgi:hypothetical protein